MEERGNSWLELGSQKGVMDGRGKEERLTMAFSTRQQSQICYTRHWNVFTFFPAVQGRVSRNLCLEKAYIYVQEQGQVSTAFPHVL